MPLEFKPIQTNIPERVRDMPSNYDEAVDILRAMDAGTYIGGAYYAREYGLSLSDARREIRQIAERFVEVREIVRHHKPRSSENS